MLTYWKRGYSLLEIAKEYGPALRFYGRGVYKNAIYHS